MLTLSLSTTSLFFYFKLSSLEKPRAEMYSGVRGGHKGGTRGVSVPALVMYKTEVVIYHALVAAYIPRTGGCGNQRQGADMPLEGLPSPCRRHSGCSHHEQPELLMDQQLRAWYGADLAKRTPIQETAKTLCPVEPVDPEDH